MTLVASPLCLFSLFPAPPLQWPPAKLGAQSRLVLLKEGFGPAAVSPRKQSLDMSVWNTHVFWSSLRNSLGSLTISKF